MDASLMKASYQRHAPRWLKHRSGKRFIGFTAFLATFNDGFLFGSIVPVLPFSLVDRSGVRDEDVQVWLSLLLVVFGLAVMVGAPIAAWVVCRAPARRATLIAGLLLVAVPTAIFCFARSPWLLLVARGLQGGSAPIIYVSSLALIADSVNSDEIGKWIGLVLSGMNLGLLIAPCIAGVVYEWVGYYAVFGTALGVLSITMVLPLVLVEKRTAAKWLDPPYPDDRGETDTLAQSAPESLGSSTGIASDTEESMSEPDEATSLLPLKPKRRRSWLVKKFPTMSMLCGSPRLGAAFYGGFLHTMLISSFDAILPLFVSRTFGWKSSAAGVMFFAITIPALSGIFVGSLCDRYGAKSVSLIGFTMVAPALACLGLITNDSTLHKVMLSVLLVLIGFGLAFILSSLAADIFHEVDILTADNPDRFDKVGVFITAYAIFNACLGLAAAIGPGLTGAVYQKANWPLTVGTMAVLCALGGVPVFLYTGPAKKKKCEGDHLPGCA